MLPVRELGEVNLTLHNCTQNTAQEIIISLAGLISLSPAHSNFALLSLEMISLICTSCYGLGLRMHDVQLAD